MKRPLELAVDHLNSIDSAWSLDLKILRDGIADACARIETLEKQVAALQAAQAPPVTK